MFIVHHSKRREPLILNPGELFLVGRGEHCDLRLDDPSASRVHCRLLSRDGKVYLTDAGSRWGTFVNGFRVAECQLRPGDLVTIGETVLRLMVAGESHGTTLARPSELQRPEGMTLQSAEKSQSLVRSVTIDEPSASDASNWRTLRASDFPGTCFHRCRVGELICRTRSGLLFRAMRDDREVALKLFHPAVFADTTTRERFQRAVEGTCGLAHPNLVSLLDGGIANGIPYSVSEVIVGENASTIIQRIGVAGMLAWRTTLRIALDIAAALAFLEEHSVLHRNITPQHILVRKADGMAKLNGLLLAKTLDDGQSSLTQTGEFVGDLPYLSPEQLGSGQPVDCRSDIYQLGATLYALLTGRAPFESGSPADLISQVANASPIPPTRYHLAVPALLEGVISSMLQKRPQERPSTSADVIRQLCRIKAYLQS